MRKLLLLTFIIPFFYIARAQNILGIDVSHYQGTIDWNQVKLSGKTFALIKATEGNCNTDPNFAVNAANATAAGVIVGAYHFVEPEGTSAVIGANHYLSVASAYIGRGFLPPVLDLETPAGICGSQSQSLQTYFTSAQLSTWVDTWCTTVKNATGITPIIYTGSSNASYLESYIKTKYKLWIASPGNTPTYNPTNIGGWANWTFMQYDWYGSVSGISGNVDLDVFHGTTTDFNQLIYPDSIAPTTVVSVPTNWQTQDFTVNFTDSDNVGGSGLLKSFYQVLYFDGTSWGANQNNGFFSDNFDGTSINPRWTVSTGTWNITASNTLQQTDESNSNTNIYAFLNQSLSNQYLYSWQGKISGTGTDKRAGLHFFCDSASQSNRGNSYFIYFRQDDQRAQIYKVSNNTYTLEVNDSFPINADQWYNFKVSYNRISGKIIVWVDGNYVTSWTDSNPIPTGNAVSFRSGNCKYEVDNFKVYRSRYPSEVVSVGNDASNDVRYQNPNPATPAAKIKSIVLDSAYNLSAIAYKFVNIDWSEPQFGQIYDGASGTDIDTIYSLSGLSAHWAAAQDSNSGISEYLYAFGTSPGDSNIVNWTSAGTNTGITANGLILITNQIYYCTVKAIDSAGLVSIDTSDGQVAEKTEGIDKMKNGFSVNIYPNPFNNSATISYTLKENDFVKMMLFNSLGKNIAILANKNQTQGKHQIVLNANKFDLSKGIYFIRLLIGNQEKTMKLIFE